MGFVFFFHVKQPPLQMKICLIDSSTNVHRQSNLFKYYSVSYVWSTLNFLLLSLTGVSPEVGHKMKHTVKLNEITILVFFGA